jgi:predicted nucleotidyltransferase
MKPGASTEFTNKYAQHAKSRPLKWFLSMPVGGILVHWTFQGMLYMDATERIFKILIDLVLTSFFYLLLRIVLPELISLVVALTLAHTLNFLFNAHYWALMKHYGRIRLSFEKYEQYQNNLAQRAQLEPSIIYAAVYGSRSRDEWKETSDLDVRFVRQHGLYYGIRSCLFVMIERTRAMFSRFPLDIFVLDGFESLRKIRVDEEPLTLKTTESQAEFSKV